MQSTVVDFLYVPYNSAVPSPTHELKDPVVYAQQSNLELLISCGTKAQDICWGSNLYNTRGEKPFDFITSTCHMTT